MQLALPDGQVQLIQIGTNTCPGPYWFSTNKVTPVSDSIAWIHCASVMFLWTFTHIKLASHKSKLHLPGVTSLVTKCTFLSVASTLASTSLHFSSRVFAAEKYDLTHHKMFLHLEAGPRMCEAIIKHCKNCECCPVSLLIVKQQRLSWIQGLNCQNCK